jgi:hypothetical protein
MKTRLNKKGQKIRDWVWLHNSECKKFREWVIKEINKDWDIGLDEDAIERTWLYFHPEDKL